MEGKEEDAPQADNELSRASSKGATNEGDQPTAATQTLVNTGRTIMIEPDVFRHTVDEAGVLIHLQFKVESEAIAFAQAFSGQLL
jgi:hypothetical protein